MSELLWQPSAARVKSTNMYDFLQYVNNRYDYSLHTYDELYQWSIDNSPEFWSTLWDYTEVIHSSPYQQVVDDLHTMPGARWFEGARLNFAENLLRFRDDHTALSFIGEGRQAVHLTYGELFQQVARLAASLQHMGVGPGDRVAAFMPNMMETVIAMLAATSLGAIWSSCSPDFGFRGVLDRFGQIEPRILFTADGYQYNGKRFDSLARIKDISREIPSIEQIVIVPYTDSNPDPSVVPNGILWDHFLHQGEAELAFTQVPANHPLYILYSSGTTGVPKCIVHGVAGTLLQHLKELQLHTDVKRQDTIFYFTTCGWMMWNWLVSALALGARVLLYDGSPFYPRPSSLWEIAEREGITIFGTSAKYLAALEKEGVQPKSNFDLAPLKAILSTGSPLSIESFHYVYQQIKEDVCLSSISGGTDIISCFALGNPMGPVYAGELQCRGLGMKVEAFDEQGKSVIGRTGELVCTMAAPSMPIYFWNDPDNRKYQEAYFSTYPGIWRHGDWVEITERGTVIIYGRSDATLNPGGVRIGTAEIYRQVETFPEIIDSLVVGQQWQDDVRIVLFVKLRPETELSDELRQKISSTIRSNCTPRHVPAKIISVPDIPYTINGKKVELAVRKIIHGEEVKNRDALANPEVLDFYAGLPELQC
ncbi:MAG: acetoacetate--CoA ligase [Deltaproteobacteria bacterium]|nr:acetoacetate--CoA ligase [Deltaproteobacteria bacterium]